MMGCVFCDIAAKKRKAAVLYEDADVMAFLSETPAVVGHIVVIPKKHAPIFEALDDVIIGNVFGLANRISAAAFSAVGAKGTNMLVCNGVAAGQEAPHFSVNIVCRQQGDGLVFDWMPKQLSEEEMAEVELRLKQGLSESPAPSPEKTQTPPAAQGEEDSAAKRGETPEEEPQKEESYLIRQLRRMP